MADKRKEYTVTINGIEHTMLLNEQDAEHYGEAAVVAKIERAIKSAVAPFNKAPVTPPLNK